MSSSEDVEMAQGVALTVTGVTQVKIMTEKELPHGPDLWTVPSKNV